MRVTSPPKHHSQLSKTTSLNSHTSTFYRQSQNPVHHLKSPQRNGQSKAQTSDLKQNLYAQLRNRQNQYVELIRGLNKQNKILKAQLGKISHNQSQRQSFSSILTLSPNKIDMNQTYGASSSDFKVFRNLQNQRVLNQTFSGFHPQKSQHFEPNQIRTHLSPFSKKPVIMSNTSPSGFKTTILTGVSPSKKPIKTIRPVSNIVQISNPVIIHSPKKKIINHSYQPSLISYKYPSQNQSIECSPKKSFQTILGLNSEVFSNSSQVHNATQQQNTYQVQASNSNFFDMKKRQLNYGSMFERQKNAQSSKSIHTTLKMSTKNYLQNQVEQIKINQKLSTDEVHLNPSTTKRHKVTKSQRSQGTEPTQIINHSPEQFKLQQNIDKNPLLNMLKKRLQEEVDFLNNDSQRNQGQSSDSVPFAQSSQYNPNIRYQNQRQNDDPIQIASMIHPLKRNMFQAFPILHKLRNSQKPNQLQQQTLQNEIINENQQAQSHQYNVGTTKQSIKRSSKRVQSNLSDKVERQDESQFIIEEVQSCRKTLTIVKMLQQHRKNQDQQIVDFIGIDRQSFEQIESKFRENEVEDLFDNNQQQLGEVNRISNRYYCENTQQDEVRVSRSVKQQQVKGQRMSRSVKQNVKKVSINENGNVFSIMQSHKVLQSMKHQQNNQQNYDEEQVQQQQLEQKQLMKQIERQDNNCQKQVQIERQQQNDDVVSNSSQQRLNQSSQYKLFYVNKKDNVHNGNQNNQSVKKYHVNNLNNTHKNNNHDHFNNVANSGIMKHRQSKLSQSNWSENTLRSQRFKKISNRAYL